MKGTKKKSALCDVTPTPPPENGLFSSLFAASATKPEQASKPLVTSEMLGFPKPKRETSLLLVVVANAIASAIANASF